MLTLKRWGEGVNLTTLPWGCLKNVFFRERMKLWFFVTLLSINISHIFSENSIKMLQIIQKIRFSSSISAVFINFPDFLIFPCYQKTNDVNTKQMISAFFYIQLTLNRLFNIWPLLPPPLQKKIDFKKPSFIKISCHNF